MGHESYLPSCGNYMTYPFCDWQQNSSPRAFWVLANNGTAEYRNRLWHERTYTNTLHKKNARRMHLDHTSLHILTLVTIHCLKGLQCRWLLDCEVALCFLQFWFSPGHFSWRSFTLTLSSSPNRLAWCAKLLCDRKIAHIMLARPRSMSYSVGSWSVSICLLNQGLFCFLSSIIINAEERGWCCTPAWLVELVQGGWRYGVIQFHALSAKSNITARLTLDLTQRNLQLFLLILL